MQQLSSETEMEHSNEIMHYDLLDTIKSGVVPSP